MCQPAVLPAGDFMQQLSTSTRLKFGVELEFRAMATLASLKGFVPEMPSFPSNFTWFGQEAKPGQVCTEARCTVVWCRGADTWSRVWLHTAEQGGGTVLQQAHREGGRSPRGVPPPPPPSPAAHRTEGPQGHSHVPRCPRPLPVSHVSVCCVRPMSIRDVRPVSLVWALCRSPCPWPMTMLSTWGAR